MGAVAEVVSDVIDPVVEVVGDVVNPIVETVENVGKQVENAVSDVVQEVGHAVEQVGQQVGKTMEAIANDPSKALVLVAVAVVAPELAPLLWEGATAAEAAMVLNTGMQLAQGADPMTIAQNLATSYVTQGITSGLDVSTGSLMADKAIGNAVGAAIQGGDINKAIGSSIGNSLIGMGTGAVAGEIRGADYNSVFNNAVSDGKMSEQDAVQLTQGKIFQDAVNNGMDAKEAADLAKTFDAGEAKLANSQIFQDAIKAGFTTDEAFAIAKGNEDAQNPTVSNPIAGASVTVEGAPVSDATQTNSPVTYASVTKEDLDAELERGELTQEEYDRLLPHASVSKSEQEYVDPKATLDQPPAEQPTSPIDATKQPVTEDNYGALNVTTDDAGNKVYTFDDGSTMTLSGETGEVVDTTDATDTGTGDGTGNNTMDNALDRAENGDYQEEEYVEEEDPNSPSGFSIKLPKTGTTTTRKPVTPTSKLIKTKLTPTTRTTTTRTTTSRTPVVGSTLETGALDATLGGGQYGVGLTQNTSTGNPEYNILGETEKEEPQGFAGGGSSNTATQGVYDLSTTASSPFLGGGNADIMALKPGVIKGKIDYALPGYPFGKEWKLAAAGGPIANAPEGHNPQFFSEGGLGSMKNTYVKGAGDGTSDSIAAMLADGEFVIPADVVSSLGNGSNDAGAKVLSEFLRTIRAHKRKADPKGLPPDSKGALGYLAAAKKKVKK